MELKEILSERLETLIEKKKDENHQNSIPKQADGIGIPYPTFVKYINGKAECPASNIIKIARYYGVSTDYLLGLSKAKTKDIEVASICDYTGLSEQSITNLNRYKKYLDTIDFIDTIIGNTNIFTNLSHYAIGYFESLRRCKELKEKYPNHLIENPHLHLPSNPETFTIDEKHEEEERELHAIYANEIDNVQPLQLYKLQNFFMDFIKEYGEALLKDGAENG